MERRVVFSKNAEKRVFEILEHLEYRWSLRVRDKFVAKLDNTIKLIQTEPHIFPKSHFNKRFHKCVLSKQTTIYYEFNTKKVFVLAFFDTRQDPTKIKKDIK